MTTTANLTVGRTVYADMTSRIGNARTIVATGEVVRITASGVIGVQFASSKRSFLPSGMERGKDWRSAAKLIDQTTYERLRPIMITERRQLRAREAITNVTKIACNADNKADIITALKIAMAAVEAM